MKLTPPEPLASDLRSQWQLAPDVTFLNHGSFGAVPLAVKDVADDWRRRVEAEPIEMLGRRWKKLIADAITPVAAFLNAAPGTVGFVSNATEGVNCFLQSLSLRAGEELLTTTHVYNAVRLAMRFQADTRGAVYREIELPIPLRSSEAIAETVIAGLSPQTRLLVVDHVTSPTAAVFPIERIAQACRERGVLVLVDGAHAPGMLPLDLAVLERSGVTFYTGNLHKWCCAPKGTAFLWAHPDHRSSVHPMVISHYYGQGFAQEFQWQGTRDMSGWLGAGAALDFLARFGWDAVRRHNHDLAAWAHEFLVARLGVAPITPLDGSLLGSMASVRLPRPFDTFEETQLQAAQQRLYDRHRIEAMFTRWRGLNMLRVSAQLYNRADEYIRLADLLPSVAT